MGRYIQPHSLSMVESLENYIQISPLKYALSMTTESPCCQKHHIAIWQVTILPYEHLFAISAGHHFGPISRAG